MNNTACSGDFAAITCYRNSKNYGDNWISAGYALWFLREARFLNYARMLLGANLSLIHILGTAMRGRGGTTGRRCRI